MPKCPDERREAVVAKLLPPRNLSVREVVQQERRQDTQDAKVLHDRVPELKRDLRRKNAALAETAALLSLSKKPGPYQST